MKPKIIFFGSDRYSQIVLKAIKKDGRFRIVQFTPEVSPRAKLGSPSTSGVFDLGVLASYGKILPKEILVVPKHGILNLHPSLLPKYRGPTPVQAAILNGEQETGVTIIKMDEKVDHGPIVAQFTEEILLTDTSESLYFRLFSAGAEVLTTILPAYLENRIEPRVQDHSQATYTKKLTRDDGKINWGWSPEKIERHVRAMSPWPGAWTEITIPFRQYKTKRYRQYKRLKILKAHLKNDRLVLDLVQLEGRKPVSFKQFQEGYSKAEIGY